MPEPPDIDQLQRLLEGSLEPSESAVVEQHLDSDPAWQAALERLSGVPDLTSEFLQPARSSPKVDRSAVLLDLIDRLKSAPPSEIPDGQWREILGPPPDPNQEGLLGTLGDYEVVELIAQGGMGLVLKARDPSLDRLVALKALSPRLAANRSARERFLREARAVAALEHENILPIYSVHEGDESSGVPWFAMRYLDGGSLGDLLESTEGPLPFAQLVSIARQVADALQASHAREIIHRDLKPSNILLEQRVGGAREGTGSLNVFLTDFGLARATDDPSLTYPGFVAGTPHYMAPEQVEGGEIDHRADLFGLGALLYHAATGRPPFDGATSVAVMREVADTAPPRPSRLNAGLPKWFSNLVCNLLAKNPAHRTPSASAVLEAIEKRHAPRPALARNRKLLVAAGVLVALLLVSALLLLVPAVARQANLLLANDEHPFFNTRKLGVHSSLAAAVRRARAGDTISIGTDATVDLAAPVRIPPDKPLTIRAASGFSPRLDVSSAREMPLTCQSDLTLERLTITRSQGGPSPVLECRSGTLVLDRCHVLVEGTRGKPNLSTTIRVQSGAGLQLRDTNLMTGWTLPVVVSNNSATAPATSIEIDNSNLTGFSMLTFYGVEEESVKLEIRRSAFTGPIVFSTLPTHPLPRLDLKVRDTVFNSDASLWWIPGKTHETFRVQVRWEGTGNLFQEGIGFLRTTNLPDRRSGPAEVATLEEWQALPSVLCQQPAQARLWSAQDSERHLPSNRFDITVDHLRTAAAPFLKPYPGIGPDLDHSGPDGRSRAGTE